MTESYDALNSIAAEALPLPNASTPEPEVVPAIATEPTTEITPCGKAEEAEQAEQAEQAETASADSALPTHPPDSLIGRWVSYAETQVETPTPFLETIALKIVEITLGRRVWIQWGVQKIFPNTYHVMVGPSGQTRRSQGIDLGETFINEIAPGRTLATITSAEKLVQSFAERNERSLIASEGKAVIDMMNRIREVATLLIKLYDSQAISTEFKKDPRRSVEIEGGQIVPTNRIEATNPFLSVGLGIAPEVLRLTDENQENGVMGRFLLQFADRRGRDIFAAPPAAPEVRAKLVEDFRKLQTLAGAVTLSSDAQNFFEQINRDNHLRLDQPMPPAIASFVARIPFTALRIAISYEAASSGSRTISADTLRCALRHVEQCYGNYKYFYGEMRKDKLSRCAERILKCLEEHGPELSHSELFRRVSSHGEYSEKQYKAALSHLHTLGKIVYIKNSKTYFPNVRLISGGDSDKAKNGDTDTTAPASVAKVQQVIANASVGATRLLKINAGVLRRAVAAVAFAASEDKYTEIYPNAVFVFDTDGMCIAASDGRVAAMIRVPRKAASYMHDTGKILLSCKLLTRILRALNENGTITLDLAGENVILSCTGSEGVPQLLTLAMPPARIRQTYPNVVSVLTAAYPFEIKITNRDDLINALKSVHSPTLTKLRCETGKEQIEFANNTKTVVVKCEPIQQGFRGVGLVPTDFLLHTLRSNKGRNVVFAFGSDAKRLVVRTENQNYFSILGLRREVPVEPTVVGAAAGTV